MPRKRRAAKLPEGRDSYHVVGPQGELAAKSEAAHALVVGQALAERAPGEVTLTIERRSLFGPTTKLYRIDQIEDGTVFTSIIDAQD